MNRGSDTLARLARSWRDYGAIGAMVEICESAYSVDLSNDPNCCM
jgi:hypothetical protein